MHVFGRGEETGVPGRNPRGTGRTLQTPHTHGGGGNLTHNAGGSLCLSQASLGIKEGYTLDGVPTHHRARTHTLSHAITHYGQFRDANQPTLHVFGPGEETRVPRGNPRGTGRTCKLHTHGGGGNRTPNPG
ncbi:hypothetical protein QTP86_015351, partial [Hemibagrus guttatus]